MKTVKINNLMSKAEMQQIEVIKLRQYQKHLINKRLNKIVVIVIATMFLITIIAGI